MSSYLESNILNLHKKCLSDDMFSYKKNLFSIKPVVIIDFFKNLGDDDPLMKPLLRVKEYELKTVMKQSYVLFIE